MTVQPGEFPTQSGNPFAPGATMPGMTGGVPAAGGARSFLTGAQVPSGRPPLSSASIAASPMIPQTATPNAIVPGPDGRPLQGNPTWADYDKWLYVNDRKSYESLSKSLKAAGTTWGGLLELASYSQAPVFDVLDQLAAEGDGRGGGGSSTSVQVNLSSESQAAAILDQSLQRELGRMATPREIKAFQRALNDAQSQNPTVTRTTSGGGASRSTTTGGFDYQRFALEYAQSQPEYAENFAATTFMDLLDKTISSPTRIDQILGGE